MNKDAIIRAAAESAIELYRQGRLAASETNLWALAESRVRARMARKGKQWTAEQIERRVRIRLTLRAIPSLFSSLPFPANLAATTVNAVMASVSKQATKEIDNELAKG